jgi:hypothetical protein
VVFIFVDDLTHYFREEQPVTELYDHKTDPAENVKSRGGKWKFNYGIFDQYVGLAMEVGIDEAITIYTPVP